MPPPLPALCSGQKREIPLSILRTRVPVSRSIPVAFASSLIFTRFVRTQSHTPAAQSNQAALARPDQPSYTQSTGPLARSGSAVAFVVAFHKTFAIYLLELVFRAQSRSPAVVAMLVQFVLLRPESLALHLVFASGCESILITELPGLLVAMSHALPRNCAFSAVHSVRVSGVVTLPVRLLVVNLRPLRGWRIVAGGI